MNMSDINESSNIGSPYCTDHEHPSVNTTDEKASMTSGLRIACLIPSATDICIALGFQKYIVGITHECTSHFVNNNANNSALDPNVVHVLTLDMINAAGATTQAAIHELVQSNSQQHCNNRSSTIQHEVPSLYPIVPQKFTSANPNLVFTQDLCNVCAPNSDSVRTIMKQQHNVDDTETEDMMRIVSLSPKSLEDVLETFRIIANACYLPELGENLIETFRSNLQLLNSTIQQHDAVTTADNITGSTSTIQQKSMLILEWLEPPFDAGHWILDMMESIGLQNVITINDVEQRKSKSRSWDEMKRLMITQREQLHDNNNNVNVKIDADSSIVVACCGFDLQRNYDDTIAAREKLIDTFPNKINRIYACDGNAYFVNPGPNLLFGITILALIAYDNHTPLVEAIQNLPYWKNSEITIPYRKVNLHTGSDGPVVPSDTVPELPDMEDADFHIAHRQACDAGAMSYIDPVTKYMVFTELAHVARGKCCGSGCRHCPYAHTNVKSEKKGQKIQQPAILYNATEDSFFSVHQHLDNVKVLFDSGGKDSFLTIRAMIKEATAGSDRSNRFGLVLLTTFDAESRIIAHQDISIDTIIKQAQHLDISLIGIPMHRGSSESYVDRIQRGMKVIGTLTNSKVTTLVFGDLHLEHIKGWRDQELGPLGYKLQYPLFRVPYDILMQDLEASQVPCTVTSSTVSAVQTGQIYDADFRRNLSENAPDVDVFGENGEFHTVAEVWKVDRNIALGLQL